MPRIESDEDGSVSVLVLGTPQPVICCDCGLTHDLTVVKVTQRSAHVRWTINGRATANARRSARYPMRHQARTRRLREQGGGG